MKTKMKRVRKKQKHYLAQPTPARLITGQGDVARPDVTLTPPLASVTPPRQLPPPEPPPSETPHPSTTPNAKRPGAEPEEQPLSKRARQKAKQRDVQTTLDVKVVVWNTNSLRAMFRRGGLQAVLAHARHSSLTA